MREDFYPKFFLNMIYSNVRRITRNGSMLQHGGKSLAETENTYSGYSAGRGISPLYP
jgi:hypothetical protein